jgi:hypothetical protein
MSTLLCVRVPRARVDDLRRCPGLVGGYFDRVMSLGQSADDDVRHWVDYGSPTQVERTKALCSALADSCRVTHAIICQPLLWYSTAAAEALRACGVRVFWTEGYFDRMILDEIGVQYTADNELVRFGHLAQPAPMPLRLSTRYAQPAAVAPEVLRRRYGPEAMPIFGQVADDMALRDMSGGMSYEQWLRALIESNPQTHLLFKHHPLKRTELPSAPNVTVVNEHVHALFAAYQEAAAYSSTVILEGVARGVRFATGGHHFMAGLTLRIGAPSDAAGVLRRLQRARPSRYLIELRLAFIENRYTVRFDEERALARLICAPEALPLYYGGEG